jgi:hypothetical protein
VEWTWFSGADEKVLGSSSVAWVTQIAGTQHGFQAMLKLWSSVVSSAVR